MKRIGDFVIACVLIVFTMPLMAIVALALKLDSPGPILLRYERLGRGGQRIMVLKFRTTLVDPRRAAPIRYQEGALTRVGRFLRYTRIDDLPELINVLRGDMTLIDAGRGHPGFVEWQ